MTHVIRHVIKQTTRIDVVLSQSSHLVTVKEFFEAAPAVPFLLVCCTSYMRYADDTAIIATSEEKLQALMDKVVEESRKVGLSINIKKTESMVISKTRCVRYTT